MDTAVKWLYDNATTALNSDSWESFIDAVGTPAARLFKKYVWLPAYYESMKAHNGRYFSKPLAMPGARKFSDLFESAELRASNHNHEPLERGPFYFVGGSRAGRAAPAGHYGGFRYVVEFTSDGSAHCGLGGASVWCSSFAKPRADVFKGLGNLGGLIDGLSSFDVVRNDDGFLVTARDRHSIGSLWVALLPLSESLFDMFNDKDRALVERNEKLERENRELLFIDTDGKQRIRADVRVKLEPYAKGTDSHRAAWRLRESV